MSPHPAALVQLAQGYQGQLKESKAIENYFDILAFKRARLLSFS